MIARLLFASILTASLTSFAQYDEEDMGMGRVSKDLMDKITKAEGLLRNNLAPTKTCEFPDKLNCNTKSLCDSLEQNSDSLYLYKNDEGKGIPNVALFKVHNSLEGCFKTNAPGPTDDPFLAPEKLVKNIQEWQKEQAKVEELFTDTQASIVKMLEDRKNGKNNKDIDNLIRRVQAVKLAKIAGDELGQLSKAHCDLPNAAYDYNNQTLIVCPQLYRYPTAALANVMAHELGHSIDPCIAGADLKESADGLFDEFSHQEKVAGKIISEAIPFDKHPFKSNVITCLSQKDSMNLKIRPLQDYLDDKTVAISEAQRGLDEGIEDPSVKNELSRLEREQKQLPQTFKYQAACLWFSENGETAESFADWVATQVMKERLGDIKDAAKAKQYALESEGVFLSYACSEVKDRVMNKILSQFSGGDLRQVQTRCYEMVTQTGSATHPEGDQRINRLHLATPEMQKALGCKPTNTKECK